jgi:Effector Associated Constant Component 1
VAQVSISLDHDDSADQLRALADWLGNENELRGRVTPVEGTLKPGQMGGVLDALTVAIGSGGAAGTLVQSLFLWLRQRRNRPSVHLKLKSNDGREVELDLLDMSDPAAIVNQIVEFFDQGK